jgi:hypothetical protein
MNSTELKKYERSNGKEDAACLGYDKKKEIARELLEVSDQLIYNENVQFFTDYRKFNELLNVRQRFLDWLSQVAKTLKIGCTTIFMTFNILDKVLHKLNFEIPKDDVFFIGIISLNLATKYLEVFKFRLKDMRQYLLNNKFSEKQIINGEMTILKLINFSLPQNHFENFLNAFLNQLWEVSDFQEEQNILKKNLTKLCLFYYKIVIMEYKTLRESKPTYLYMAVIVFSIAKYKDLTRNFPECESLLKLSFMHLKTVSKVKKLISAIELWTYSALNNRAFKNVSKEYKELVMSFNKID